MIRVNARLFKAASLFSSTDESRYYIHGVCVEPHQEGALLAATDGHRLIVILDRSGLAERNAIIKLPALMMEALVEEIENRECDECGAITHVRCDDRTLLVPDDNLAEIVDQFRALESCEIKGAFPDWRVVMRGAASCGLVPRVTPAFDSRYLADLARMADLLGDAQYARVHVVATDAEGPALVFFPAYHDAVAVIMPTKSTFEQDQLRFPTWLLKGGK
jgi:DNA polymerase III beta subunit, central domain